MNEPTELQQAVDSTALRVDHAEYENDEFDLFKVSQVKELLSAAKQLSALQALSDLHRDEFKRIRAIATDTEIQGLCARAVTQIEQHAPLIVQRDSAVRQYLALRAENEELIGHLKHIAFTYCGIEIGKPLEGIDEPETDVSMVAAFVEGVIDEQAFRADKAESERDSLTAALKECAEALKKNHVWHTEYDEYQGYDESDLCEANMKALSNSIVQKLLKP